MKKKFDPATVRRNKQFFDVRREAVAVAEFRSAKCFKMKHGRHKGQYFVGSYFEYLNVY